MYTIGIDLGGTNIAVGLCDSELNIIEKKSTPTLPERDPREIVKDMAALCDAVTLAAGLKTDDIDYVGIASPGTVNTKTGIVEYSNNIPFHDFPIADVLKDYFPIKQVFIANDANAAALAESLKGAAKGTKTSVMITLGTGVGGGVVIDGKIYDGGVNPAGAELGHTVIVAKGKQCSCGRRGCWEAYSSATGLTNMTKDMIRELELKGVPSLLIEEARKSGKVSARTAFDAMKLGDKYAKEVVDDYIFYLAEGITNMVNIFQPEILSIGGGVCNEGDTLIIPLTALVERDQYTRGSKNKTKIVRATLGNDAGIIGAAGLGK